MATYKLNTHPLDTDEASYTLGTWVDQVPDPVDGYALVWRQDYNVSFVIGTGNGIAARVTNDVALRDKLPLGVGLGLVPPTDTIFFTTDQLPKPIVPQTLVITGVSTDGETMTVRDSPVSIPENRGNLSGDVEPQPRNMLQKDGVNVFRQNTVNYNRAALFFQFRKPLDTSSPVTVSYQTSGLRFEECCGGRTYSFHNDVGTRTSVTHNSSTGEDEVRVAVELDDLVGTGTGLISRFQGGTYGTTDVIDIDPGATGSAITVTASGDVGIGTTTPSTSFEVAGDITVGTDSNGNPGAITLNGRTIADIDTEVVRVLNASSIAASASGDVEFTNAIRVADTQAAVAGSVRFNQANNRVEAHTGQRWIEVARDENHGRTSNTRTPGQSIPVTTVTQSNTPYDVDSDDGLIVCDGGGTSVELRLPNPQDYTGTWFQIKDKSGNLSTLVTITIVPPSGILLDGTAGSHVVTVPLTAVGVVSTGAEWLIF